MRASSRVRVFFVLGCALACCALGVYLIWRGDGPAVGVDSAGELIYPQSSGDGDCMFLGVGLVSFAFTACAAWRALGSAVARRKLARRYFTSLAVFLAMLWLVLLDSNLIDAASAGDAAPLFSLLPAFAPAALLFVAGAARLVRGVSQQSRRLG
jgi:hypothetical protein